MRIFSNERRGFALVIVLTLLAMLVLATYAISLVGRIDTQVGSIAMYQLNARQNALLALRIAHARLQVNAGPQPARTSMAGMYQGINPVNSRWTAIWTPGGRDIEWMVSGDQTPDSYDPQLTVEPGGTPYVAEPVKNVIIVGHNSVSTASTVYRAGDIIAIPKTRISTTQSGLAGSYAYWVGDEGTKVSAYVPASSAQIGLNGIPIRPYLRYLINVQFNPENPLLDDAVSFRQIGFIQSGFSPSQAFHGLTVSHVSLLESVEREGLGVTSPYVRGLLNVNNLNAATWRAILMTIQGPPSNQPVLNYRSKDLDLSRKLAEKIEARGTPFESVDQFEASHVIHQALVDAVLTNSADPTEADIFALIGPALTTRSDTFRIRAYGEAMNPADADDPEAKPEAVAYCEAIVQRTDRDLPGYGKKFVITYFRWLGPDDI